MVGAGGAVARGDGRARRRRRGRRARGGDQRRRHPDAAAAGGGRRVPPAARRPPRRFRGRRRPSWWWCWPWPRSSRRCGRCACASWTRWAMFESLAGRPDRGRPVSLVPCPSVPPIRPLERGTPPPHRPRRPRPRVLPQPHAPDRGGQASARGGGLAQGRSADPGPPPGPQGAREVPSPPGSRPVVPGSGGEEAGAPQPVLPPARQRDDRTTSSASSTRATTRFPPRPISTAASSPSS